jgi:uncharacterized phage-associated protein
MSFAMSVAKELVKLSFAGDEKDPLTDLRLQKLLYYAQAWSLVIRESELFPEDIQAWRWGPVVPDVYRALPDGLCASPITLDMVSHVPDLPAEDARFVQSVWEAYNQHSATQLSRMTHAERPYMRSWGDRPTDGTGTGDEPIPVDELEDYFGSQTVPAPLAAYQHELRKREEEAARKLAQIGPVNVAVLAAASASYTPLARKLLASGG